MPDNIEHADDPIDVDEFFCQSAVAAKEQYHQLCVDVVLKRSLTAARIRETLWHAGKSPDAFKADIALLRSRKDGQELVEQGRREEAFYERYTPAARHLVAHHEDEAAHFARLALEHRKAAEFFRQKIAERQSYIDTLARGNRALRTRRTRSTDQRLRDLSQGIIRLNQFLQDVRPWGYERLQTLRNEIDATRKALAVAEHRRRQGDIDELKRILEEHEKTLAYAESVPKLLADAKAEIEKSRQLQAEVSREQGEWQNVDLDRPANATGPDLPPANGVAATEQLVRYIPGDRGGPVFYEHVPGRNGFGA